jgi:hypothetical protein
VKWIHLAEDRDRWRAVVNVVMNLRVLAPQLVITKVAAKVSLNQRGKGVL